MSVLSALFGGKGSTGPDQPFAATAMTPAADAAAEAAAARVGELEARVGQLEEELRFNEERYSLMIDAANIGLWDMSVIAGDPVNPNNEFWWSDHFRRMLGFRNEQDFPNVLDSWASRLHPEDYDWVIAAFAAHLTDRTGRTPYDVRYRLQMKSGEYRWFRASGSTRRASDGTPVRVAGALIDIHEEKTLLEGSSELSERLQESSAQLSSVSGQMADSTRRAVELAGTTGAQIQKLATSSAEIGKVVQLITTIAEQTNLLALNATIESARAGDAGRGFAVVANEVKELADETARATGEISSQVETIRNDTESAVAAIASIEEIIGTINGHQDTIMSVVETQRQTAAERAAGRY